MTKWLKCLKYNICYFKDYQSLCILLEIILLITSNVPMPVKLVPSEKIVKLSVVKNVLFNWSEVSENDEVYL